MHIRFTWPWGRLSPSRRLGEIDRLIQRHQATMKIIESQTREAMRLHAKSIQALQEQRRIVETFLDEDRRKAIMDRAYALETAGIPVLDRIALADTPEEIDAILDEADSNPSAFALQNPPIGTKIPKEDHVHDLFAAGVDDEALFANEGDTP